jgi:glycosyltransferase involved in cell wall biosynthesis
VAEDVRDPSRVSVIMAAYNAADTISDQLAALEAQTFEGDWEIIVADNASTDWTARVVHEWRARFPRVHLVEAREQRGPGYARNVAIAQSHGDLIAFCDADDIVDPRWLEELVEAARHYDAVGGRMTTERLKDPLGQWRWRDVPESGLLTLLEFLPFAETANLAVWRNALNDVGGVPLHLSGQDVALCWNLQIRGYRLGFAPAAHVHRRTRAGLWAMIRQWHRYGVAHAELYKQFRAYGAQRRGGRATLRAWFDLVRRSRLLVGGPSSRSHWLAMLAMEAGHLRGAWRHRVYFTG